MSVVARDPVSLSRRAFAGVALGGLAVAGLDACSPRTQQQVAIVPLKPAPLKRDLQAWPTLDAMAQAMIARRQTPGLSVSVLKNGALLYSRGFGLGDISTGAAATPQSGFRIASVTKQFTAAAILLLAGDGRLSVTDPLARFLPDYPNAAAITLAEMMSHTAGLGDYINGQDATVLGQAQTRDYTTDELLAIIRASTSQRSRPGTRYAYSNSGFALLGIVVERVSGLPFAQFLQQRIFNPVGMAGTGIDSSAAAPACCGYRPNHLAGAGFGPVYPVSPSFIGGAGAIRSCTEDLCRWHDALLHGRVLEPAGVVAMLTPARLSDGRFVVAEREGYGFGQRLGMENGQPYLMHGGMVNGFASHLRSYPVAGITVACLYNCDGVGSGGFWQAQHDLRIEASRLALAA